MVLLTCFFKMLSVAAVAFYNQPLSVKEQNATLTHIYEHIKKTKASLLMMVIIRPRVIVFGKYLHGDT